MTSLAPFLAYWRTTVARDREIVEAVVLPEHHGPSPDLARALAGWSGVYYWASGSDAGRLVLVRPLAAAPRERWWLHAVLFLGTFITVQLGGAKMLGESVHTLPSLRGGVAALSGNVAVWLQESVVGIPFAMALLAILLAHEMGHYLMAKRYGINASPPYFIPAPVEFNPPGTFGAFIRLRSPVVDRRQLMDVGAAGPLVGFAVALLMLIVGFQQSLLVPAGTYDAPMVIELANGWTWLLGDSLVTWGVREWLVGDGTLVLHPLAVAGWLGMLITALNLFPLGQLDGGHVLYALFGDRQRYIGVLAWIGLLVLGRWYWPWWIWAALTLALGGGRLAHPRVLERRRPLPLSRVPIGLAAIALFALTFAPIPLSF